MREPGSRKRPERQLFENIFLLMLIIGNSGPQVTVAEISKIEYVGENGGF